MSDVLNGPQLTDRRRRFEWPTLDLPNLHRMQEEPDQGERPPATLAQVVRVVHGAASACYGPKLPEHYLPGDDGLACELEKKNPDYEMLLNNLYWRGRQQSAIFDLWIILYERGLVRWENMEADIDYSNSTGDSSKVYMWLACFTAVQEEKLLVEHEPFRGFNMTWFPLTWLAIMIARGCADEPHKILETIHHTGVLGKLDPRFVKQYIPSWGDYNIWHCDPKCHGLRPDMPNWRMDFFGSWLPKGLGSDRSNWTTQIMDKFMGRFWAVERAYKDFYAIPDDVLVEDRYHSEFLKRHSERELRRKYSGHCKL